MGQGDEPHYMVLTESILFDRDIDVSNNYKSNWQGVVDPGTQHVIFLPDGRELPYATVGLPLLSIPTFLTAHLIRTVGEKFGHYDNKVDRWRLVKNTFSISMMIVTSFFSLLLWKLFAFFTREEKLSWVMALILTISLPIASYGFLTFTALPLAFILTYLFYRVACLQSFNGLSAILLGFLPWIHPRTGIAAVAFTLFFLHGAWSRHKSIKKELVLASLAAAGWMGYWVFYASVWGSTTPTYMTKLDYEVFHPKFFPIAIPGLFFDRTVGLFIQNPIYILIICGALIFLKLNRKAAIIMALISACYLAPAAGFEHWWAGWCPGPRYLVPITPFLGLLVVLTMKSIWEVKQYRWIVKSILGFTVVLAFLYWHNPRLMWHYDEPMNRFLDHYLGSFSHSFQQILPSFFESPPGPQIKASIWGVLLVVLNLAIYKKVKKS